MPPHVKRGAGWAGDPLAHRNSAILIGSVRGEKPGQTV